MTSRARPQRRLTIASAGAAGAILLATLLVTRGSDGRSTCRSTLIPAYLSPEAIVDAVNGSSRPRLLVINPLNGPGLHARSTYREAVRAAQDRGARVLGYVPTSYGARPAAEVTADIDRYRAWYGVDGIFLDEAANTAAELPYYRALGGHVGSDGLVVLNPGVVPAPGYFDVADVVVTFEGPYDRYADALAWMPAWLRRVPPERIAHLVYGASRGDAMAAIAHPDVPGYLYVTSGSLPDPWRTLPSYLHEEEEALEACS